MGAQLSCLLCNTSTSSEIVSSYVRDDPEGYYMIRRCLTCGHVQLFPLPSDETDAAFYDADSQRRVVMGGIDFEAWQRKSVVDTARRVQWVVTHINDKSKPVLDVGCGYGFFVNELTLAGYQAVGLDVSTEALALATSHQQGEFLHGQIDPAFVNEHAGNFSTVTLFQVLEHTSDPVGFLRLSLELVAEDGYLLVEVPNLKDDLLEYSEQYRAFYWQRAHLSYFDTARLELAFQRAGFRTWTIRGIQRYGLRNLLHWLDQGAPQLLDPAIQTDEPGLRRLEKIYRADRENSLKSDTLFAEIHR